MFADLIAQIQSILTEQFQFFWWSFGYVIGRYW